MQEPFLNLSKCFQEEFLCSRILMISFYKRKKLNKPDDTCSSLYHVTEKLVNDENGTDLFRIRFASSLFFLLKYICVSIIWRQNGRTCIYEPLENNNGTQQLIKQLIITNLILNAFNDNNNDDDRPEVIKLLLYDTTEPRMRT